MIPKPSLSEILPSIRFKTSRSGGSGGQNVNKVATKVELLFDLDSTSIFTEEEKTIIREKLASRFQADGFLQVISQETRSQLENKEIALKKLMDLLQDSLKERKKRKKTKPSKKANQARLDSKRKQSLKKINRKISE